MSDLAAIFSAAAKVKCVCVPPFLISELGGSTRIFFDFYNKEKIGDIRPLSLLL